MKREEWLNLEREFRAKTHKYYKLRAQHCKQVGSKSEEYRKKAEIYYELAKAADKPTHEDYRRLWMSKYNGWKDPSLQSRFVKGSREFSSVEAYVRETLKWTDLYQLIAGQTPICSVNDILKIEIIADDSWAKSTSLDLAVYGLYVVWNPDSLLLMPERLSEIRELFKIAPDNIRSISPRQFEEFIAYLLETFGCRVKLTKQSRDFGADILVWHGGLLGEEILTAVQVKRYAEHFPVGLKQIYELYGAVAHYQADVGMIITTSRFTKPALNFASKKKLKIIDFNKLHYEFMKFFSHSR